MGTGSAIEKQTPYFAFGQILCAAANLSTSPSYGEVLALKHTYQLDEEDVNALGIICQHWHKQMKLGRNLNMVIRGSRRSSVFENFQSNEAISICIRRCALIDSQSWVMLQMAPQLSSGSIVMIVTRPPDMASQMKGGGQMGTEEFIASEEKKENDFIEDNDRVKFSRILSGLKSQTNIELMSLGVMGSEAMRELIAKTIDVPLSSVDDAFVSLMNEKAGGIPMYLTSMTAWLKERNMVSKKEDGTINFNGDISDIKFPNSIMDTVLERVDSLGDTAKTLIKVCACFGFEFGTDYLDKLLHNFYNVRYMTICTKMHCQH